MKPLALVLILSSCATVNPLAFPMEVHFADRVPYAEEILICVPKIDQTLRCASLMTRIPKPKGNHPPTPKAPGAL